MGASQETFLLKDLIMQVESDKNCGDEKEQTSVDKKCPQEVQVEEEIDPNNP